MPKRIFWMTTGYATGAASSWWVQRKVKKEVEKVIPNAVRNEVTTRVTAATGRVSAASDKALEKTVNSPIAAGANKVVQKVRPDIDLTDRAQARLHARQQPTLTVLDGDMSNQPGINRLRERARRFRG